jgi:hypothetical protein
MLDERYTELRELGIECGEFDDKPLPRGKRRGRISVLSVKSRFGGDCWLR